MSGASEKQLQIIHQREGQILGQPERERRIWGMKGQPARESVQARRTLLQPEPGVIHRQRNSRGKPTILQQASAAALPIDAQRSRGKKEDRKLMNEHGAHVQDPGH